MHLMDWRRGIAASIIALGLSLSTADAAAGATPSALWRGAKTVQVLCYVAADRQAERSALQDRLCGRVRTLAAQGAPMPVRSISVGDPAVLGADAVTLLVHGAVQPTRGGRTLAFSVRPFRVSTEQTESLFGASPRAADLPGGPALDAAIVAALDETLPWRAETGAGPDGARPIG